MRHIAFCLLLLCTLTATAQDDKTDRSRERMRQFTNRLDEGDKTGSRPAAPTRASKEGDELFTDTAKVKIKARSFPDVNGYYSECYANVVNKYGFWKGLGPKLSKEDIKHTRRYFKLLRPAGQPSTAPFTHMQILDPWGNPFNESYGPILANPFGSDTDISSSWKYKLKDICQFEKISRNGVMVQENMYDKNGTLVLQYFPTSVSQNRIIGHYIDAYGSLAHLREDKECTYVGILLDENGYETRVTFMDDEGHIVRNSDGAFTQIILHDAEGNLLQTQSGDAMGTPILDNWGNCGWRYEYNKKGWMTSATCIDQFGSPMRMPKRRSEVSHDCIHVKYSYDNWGNQTECAFFDADGNPDTITGGIHRYLYQHTLYANTTLCRSEDLNGHLVNYDTDKAMWIQHLDNQGHRLYIVTLNADSLLTTSGTCLERARYVDGQRVWQVKYKSTDGLDTVPTYRFVSTPECDSIINFEDNKINIERYDSKRRLVSDEYYTLDMEPSTGFLDYHIKQSIYTDTPQSQHKEVKYLGFDHELQLPTDVSWRSYNRDVYHYDYAHHTYYNHEFYGDQIQKRIDMDSVAHLRVTTKYDNGHIADKYGNLLSDDNSEYIGLIYFDSLGYRGRSFRADALYYTMQKNISIQGTTVAWQSLNEFGEPCYAMTGDWNSAPIYCVNVLNDAYYYDENGDTIPSTADGRKEFKDNLYKAFVIELVDTLAYNLGLRTGDLIVRYGDWHYPIPSILGRYRENLLCYETIRYAALSKTIVVMRHDPATRTSQLLQFELPQGTPRQLGLLYHMIYLTTKENERYKATVQSNLINVRLNPINSEQKGNDELNFFKPCKVGRSSSKQLFMSGFQDNAIVLAWEAFMDGQSYFFSVYDKQLNAENVFEQKYDSIYMYYTVDALTTQRHIFHNNDFTSDLRYYVVRSRTNVSDGSTFHRLASELQQRYDALHPRTPIVLTPHQAAERLLQIENGVTESTNSGSGFRGTGQYNFGDVQQYRGVIYDYSKMSYPDMFTTRDIMAGLDFSQYFYGHSKDDTNYLLRDKKGRFTEVCWTSSDGIRFLTGNVTMSDMQLITTTIEPDSTALRIGLGGKYIILQYADWRLGMTDTQLTQTITRCTSQPCTVRLAQLIDTESGIKLASPRTYTIPAEGINASPRWELLPEHIFAEALRLAKLK